MKYDIHLIWDVISTCNFKCDYCLAGSQSAAEKLRPVDIGKVTRVLADSGRIYEINLVGGEPTLLPNFVEVCEQLTRRHYLFLSTNLSRYPVFDAFIKRIDPDHITGIDASFHAEERLKRSSFKKYAEYVLRLRDAGFKIRTNYVAHPRLMDRIVADFREIGKLGVELKATPYIGVWNGKTYPDAYTDSEKTLLFDEEIHTGKWDASIEKGIKDQYCNAGYNAFWVARDGTVSKCTTFLNRTYGNIYEKIEPGDKVMKRCNATSCSCPYYAVLSTLFQRAEAECGIIGD